MINIEDIESDALNELQEALENENLVLFNTLWVRKEAFHPIQPWRVTLYSCWPTVYSEAHIWNMRAYIFPDVLKRVLRWMKLKVVDIINITDVWHLTDDGDDGDDKMELAAQTQWKNIWEIAQFYTDAFLLDFQKLNISLPTKFTRATDYIEPQIDMIKTLEEKWFTYVVSDGVYFDTSRFSHYWDFAWIISEDLEGGKRISLWEKKHNTDFALWKFSPVDKQRQMEWDSPWWKWFPWWHIECSAMIRSELWKTIDIHTGGEDHVRVHHTNEIAQSQCCDWHNPAHYWLHGAFLLNGGNKVAKSAGGAFTISKLEELWIHPMAYRLYLLMSHYRSPVQFSMEALQWCVSAYARLQENVVKLLELQPKIERITVNWRETMKKIVSLILNDLNTPQVLAEMWWIFPNKTLTNYEKIIILLALDQLLWLKIFESQKIAETPLPEDIIALWNERWEKKKKKDFSWADSLRMLIEKKGYKVFDMNDKFTIKKI